MVKLERFSVNSLRHLRRSAHLHGNWGLAAAITAELAKKREKKKKGKVQKS